MLQACELHERPLELSWTNNRMAQRLGGNSASAHTYACFTTQILVSRRFKNAFLKAAV